jgi:CheY-like chemotaxis protein
LLAFYGCALLGQEAHSTALSNDPVPAPVRRESLPLPLWLIKANQVLAAKDNHVLLQLQLERRLGTGALMRVLIADDQEFIRRGVRAVLSGEKDIEICAEAVDGRDALVKALEFRPDVVIMDILMPQMDGIDAIRLIRKALPQVKVVSLSLYDVPEMADEVEQAGAAAFVSKLLVWDNLVPMLRRVQIGETFLS